MRGWQGEALTGVGRYMVRPGTALSRRNPRHLLLEEGAARRRRVWRGPLKTKAGPRVCSPRRRKPSPPGKVDRAQPGPDEGKQPKSEKQATLNGSVFHSTWPVSLLGCGPSSVTPYGVPPSPEGKATSRRGLPPAGASFIRAYSLFQGSPPHPSRAAPGPPSPSRRGQGCSVSRKE